ncbi:MAG: glycosyltransferase [Thermodesulfobacteriota bacterium]
MPSAEQNNAPLKVCFLLRSLNFGGAERQVVLLAREMVRLGHQVSVLVFYGQGPLEAELRDSGCSVVVLDKQGRWDLLAFLPRLVRAIRGQGAQVLHSYLDVPNALAVLLKPLLGGLSVVWGVRASDMDLSRYGWLDRLAFGLERLLARGAELIICNSQAGLEHVRAVGFPAQRLLMIPNAVDSERFRPLPEAGQALRRELGLGPQELLVGLVGRLDPMKDHPNFLEAAALVAAQEPRARFLCLGDGPEDYRRRLASQAEGLGLGQRLIWRPGQREVEQVYSALDVLCSASLYGEGFPNVVAEAMACERVCVVTQVGDAPVVLADCGLTAPPGDPPALAQALLQALHMPAEERAELGRRARRRIKENFAPALLAQRTCQALAQSQRPGV